MRFEYKHFAFIGAESTQAAEAAECANEQGQFWPYHNTLFANQRGENVGAFRDAALKNFAVAIGLDEAAFNECLDSGRHSQVIQTEIAEGRERGVESTPTLFINGERINGAIPFDQLKTLIQIQLGISE